MTDINAKTPERKKGGRAFQLVWSLILFAGFAALLFFPNVAPMQGSADHASLWDQILQLFKGEFVGSETMKYALYAFAGFYALLVIFTVAAFFTNRTGTRVLNYIRSFTAVAAALFFVCALMRDGATLADIFRNEKTFIAINSTVLTLGLGILSVIVLVFSQYRGFGFVKFVSCILTLGAFVFALGRFTLLDNVSFETVLGGITLTGPYAEITALALRALVWGTIANALLTLFLIALPRTAVFDVIRTAVMTAIGIAVVVLTGMHAGFSQLLSHVGTVGLAGITLIQLIFAIIVLCAVRARKKAKMQEDPFVVDSNDQMAIKGLEAPAEEISETVQSASAQEAAQDAMRANAAFDDASQISIDDLTAAEAEPVQEQPDYEDAIHEEPTQEIQEEPAFDFEQAKYDGKFNRAYAEFAEKQEAAEKAADEAKEEPVYGNYSGYAQQAQQAYTAPNYGAQPPYGQQAQGYYAPGYVPDAFFSSLTPAERDEFDRLFISRIYGDNKRLPEYRIGGDNREFFTKIFVFMGRYRNVISDGLLEKIYNYSNSIR